MVCVSFCVICIAERLVSSVICRFQGLSYSHVPECIEFSFILFIHHNIHFYFELCTYCNILDIYLSWNMNSVKYLFIWNYWIIYFVTCLEVQYEPKKICRRAAECGRPLSAAHRRLPTLSGNGGERQTPVIFTPRAVLDPMLQTMMDPGTSSPVIPLHESQVTAVRLTGGNSFRNLHMCALCTLYTGRIE